MLTSIVRYFIRLLTYFIAFIVITSMIIIKLMIITIIIIIIIIIPATIVLFEGKLNLIKDLTINLLQLF